MRRLAILAAALPIACAAPPLPPEWQSESSASLQKFSQQYLEGDARGAQRSFQRAKAAVAATGRSDLAARVELVRCAIGTAALDFDACGGYEAMQADATVGDRAYGDFVSGRLQAAQVSSLPGQYREVAAARDDAARSRALSRIGDPVSRLVAAGALFRAKQLAPEGVAAAVAAASAQGYRQPLLAWLGVQEKRAQAAGDAAAAAEIRKRMDLVAQSMPAAKP